MIVQNRPKPQKVEKQKKTGSAWKNGGTAIRNCLGKTWESAVLNASLAAILPLQGAGQGKLFNKRKAANSRFGSLRFGRISSFQEGVLQI